MSRGGSQSHLGESRDIHGGDNYEEDDDDEEAQFRIQVHRSAHQLTAYYTLDETRMSLDIRLSSNHPLTLPSVSLGDLKSQGGGIRGQSGAGKWPLKILAILTSQNANIGDAIGVWRQALDQQFEVNKG